MTLDLEAIRARAEKATEGPWKHLHRGRVFATVEVANAPWFKYLDEYEDYFNEKKRVYADAEFIAHARQDIPALLAEIDRLNEFCANCCGHCDCEPHCETPELKRLRKIEEAAIAIDRHYPPEDRMPEVPLKPKVLTLRAALDGGSR